MLSSLNIPLLQRAPNIKVLVRGWLNCNQIVINQESANVVIDAGYHSHAETTLALLRAPEVSQNKNYSRLMNTHCHSDHMGGNAALQRELKCSIEVPLGEAAGVRPWSRQSFWLDYADQHAEPFDYDKTIEPNEVLHLGGFGWRAVAAPGHDMGALMFYCAELKLLISGDALWQNGLGAITPKAGTNPGVEAALATLQTIRELDIKMVIPGHGKPFADVDDALARAESRLRAYQAEPKKCARNFLKSIFTFHLLEVGAMALDQVPNYFARVPCYVDINAEFFQLAPQALADLLIGELLAVNAITINERKVYPTMAV
jgi:glyoxylase-like metal-dependent hydrolase (beta-lactamase superfamily II)